MAKSKTNGVSQTPKSANKKPRVVRSFPIGSTQVLEDSSVQFGAKTSRSVYDAELDALMAEMDASAFPERVVRVYSDLSIKPLLLKRAKARGFILAFGIQDGKLLVKIIGEQAPQAKVIKTVPPAQSVQSVQSVPVETEGVPV